MTAPATSYLSLSLRDTIPAEEASGQTRSRRLSQRAGALFDFSLFRHHKATLGILVENGWIVCASCIGTPAKLVRVNAVPLPDKTLFSPECLAIIQKECRSCPPDTQIWFRLDAAHTVTLHTTVQAEGCSPEEAFAMLLARQDGTSDAASLLFQYRLASHTEQRLFRAFQSPERPERQPLAVLAADKNRILHWRQCCADAQIMPYGFTDAMHCLENLYASGWLDCPWDCFALAAITESGTHLLVIERKKNSTQVRPLVIASRTFRTGIRELLEPSEPHTENTATKKTAFLQNALSAPLQRLGQQIRHEIDPEKGTGFTVQGLVVTGPEAVLEAALCCFSTLVSLPCHALALSGPMSSSAHASIQSLSNVSAISPPPLLQVIGLSLASPTTPNVLFGFQEQRERERRTFRIKSLIIGMTIGLLFCVGLAGKGLIDLLAARAHRDALQNELAGWQTLVTLDDLERRLKETETINLQARALAKRRFPAAILAEIAAMTPSGIRLAEVKLLLPETESDSSRKTSPRASSKKQQPTAILSGIATGDTLQRESQLAAFLSQLEQCPVVASLLIEKQPAKGDMATFTATARLSLP